MDGITFGARLRQWRKANNIKQAALAHDLNVTQAAVSRWENSIDEPSSRNLSQIRAMMAAGSQEESIAVQFISRQLSLRALFDVDGMKLLTCSRGLQQLWPEFSTMLDTRMADHMIGESAPFAHDPKLAQLIRRGELALVTGVSLRHLDLEVDRPFLHRWHGCTRQVGGRTMIELVYDPCEPDARPGIEDMVIPDLIF